MLTLSCHNMEINTTIENRGSLIYTQYRCLYKHISNSIRNILKWFAAFERVVSLQSNFVKTHTTFRIMFYDVKNCQ